MTLALGIGAVGCANSPMYDDNEYERFTQKREAVFKQCRNTQLSLRNPGGVPLCHKVATKQAHRHMGR